jgi:YidC/Oxa1 family membrane protein insertase
MSEHTNTILAIVLSAVILLAWQFIFGLPQMEKHRQEALQRQAQQKTEQKTETTSKPTQSSAQPAGNTTAPGAEPPAAPGTSPAPPTESSRAVVLAAGHRVAIDTPDIKGSINLKGARIDDVSLVRYRETVNPNSPAIVLLSPSGTPHPFYAEFGWVGTAGSSVKLPGADTVWKQEGSGTLTPTHPITLVYDNGEGLQFRRTISIDNKYLFTLKDDVVNKTGAPVTIYPYGLVSRHGRPEHLSASSILHEGLIGVMGDKGLQEVTYKKIDDKKALTFDVTDAWLGITDKYWAATLLPDITAHLQARFSAGTAGTTPTYQTDYLLDAVTVAPGATGTASGRLFAGAKQVSVVDGYDKALHLNRFELLIDWGYFYFITKPMFMVIDFFYRWTHNFGIAILIVTVLVKILFFPLANKSYASMAKMKAMQPQMATIREHWPDDKVKQQQEIMALYKREKINPIAGCLPMVIQIPVFFSLYKVLYITIEMRHAPFFGWIHDLSAPDPTNVFTLFGLLPFDPTMVPVIGSFLHLGAWPLIMGVTMWVQMKLNPTPPDPTQKMIFDWMPIIFTFMLANFSAGLVIYWAWNNTLSVIQQSVIMKRNGAKIELFDNLRGTWGAVKNRVESLLKKT